MAVQLPLDGGGPDAIPTPDDHLRATDPVSRGVPAPGQLPNVALLCGIEWKASMQQLRHGGLPTSAAAVFIPALRNGALSLGRGDRLIATARAANVQVAAIFNRRFIPALKATKRAVEEGLLGDLIAADMYHKSYRTKSTTTILAGAAPRSSRAARR
jgi:hypothetical protein